MKKRKNKIVRACRKERQRMEGGRPSPAKPTLPSKGVANPGGVPVGKVVTPPPPTTLGMPSLPPSGEIRGAFAALEQKANEEV